MPSDLFVPSFLRKCLKWWKQLKRKWHMKTPKQKWLVVYGFGAKISDLIGVTVYGHMKNGWYSFFPGLDGVVYFVTVFYTLWHYSMKSEFSRGIPSTCSMGIVCSIITVYWKTMSSDRFKVNNILNFGGKYIYKDDEQPLEYHRLCERMVVKLVKDTIIVVIAILVSYALVGCGALYAIVFHGDRVTFLGTEIPFINSETDIGFMINLIEQIFLTTISLFSNLTIEIGVCLVDNAMSMIPELIRLDSDKLKTELELNGESFNARMRVRNILMKVQDFNSYLGECIDVYCARLFIGPLCFMYSISISIFEQMIYDYPSGYGFALGSYVLLLIFCTLCENLRDEKVRISDELYNMPWYLLPTQRQKEISSVMHWVQNGATLTMGPFSELNYETVSTMTQTIFRFTMVLLNGVK